jgi:GTP-binding protein
MSIPIRNIAIIAHVDHGKTTLVDALLKQSEGFRIKSGETDTLMMDSNDLERERGITILSKNAAVRYRGVKINIVDTPGHADFGGEVERIMNMVDGVLLLVDAKEGPMPQTKFVLKKAIAAGHTIIVVINKMDKPGARPNWVLDRTFDLFLELGASDTQAEFPVIYAVGSEGKASLAKEVELMKDITPVFDLILEKIPVPKDDPAAPLQMLTVTLNYDTYKGKIVIGRLRGGVMRANKPVMHINRAGDAKIVTPTSVMVFEGMKRVDTDEVVAGDIVAIAGIPNVSIGETITDPGNPHRLPPIEIEEPTVKMSFMVNKSPFAGREGQYVTTNHLKERLMREVETDVALRVEATATTDTWDVSGRGELHLSILIEKMRREGYEFQVSRPQVILKKEDGKTLEPMEILSVEVPEVYMGAVIEELGARRGTMLNMQLDAGTAYLEFLVPTRGLIGLRNRFMNRTKGQGIMNSLFEGFEPFRGEFTAAASGSIIASDAGITRAYGMMIAEGRGELFISPGMEVYEGMIVGETGRAEDVRVNVCKEKQLSNMRAKSDGAMEFLKVPRSMSLEECIEYLSDDDLLEVTPKSLRLRKFYLSEIDEKRAKRAASDAAQNQ